MAKDAHRPKHPELAGKNVPNPHGHHERGGLSNHKAVGRNSWPRDMSTATLPVGVIQYLCDYLHLPPEIVPDTLCHRGLRRAGQCPKFWLVSDLQDSHMGKLTDTCRWSAIPPGADTKAEVRAGSTTEFHFRSRFCCGCGQPPQ